MDDMKNKKILNTKRELREERDDFSCRYKVHIVKFLPL